MWLTDNLCFNESWYFLNTSYLSIRKSHEKVFSIEKKKRTNLAHFFHIIIILGWKTFLACSFINNFSSWICSVLVIYPIIKSKWYECILWSGHHSYGLFVKHNALRTWLSFCFLKKNSWNIKISKWKASTHCDLDSMYNDQILIHFW